MKTVGNTFGGSPTDPLLSKAIEVLGDEPKAQRWISSPQWGLGGATPLDFCKKEGGLQKVIDLLGRIEMGVYS